MQCLGWTWEQAEGLTLPRYEALCRYWESHPPVHLMVAAYLGIKPKPRPLREGEEQDYSELFALM